VVVTSRKTNAAASAWPWAVGRRGRGSGGAPAPSSGDGRETCWGALFNTASRSLFPLYNPDEIWQCRFLRTVRRQPAGPERLYTHTNEYTTNVRETCYSRRRASRSLCLSRRYHNCYIICYY